MSDVSAAAAIDKTINSLKFIIRVSFGTVIAVAVARAISVPI